MHANHPRAKGLEQLLAVTAVVAEVSDDQRISVVAGVNLRQGTGAHTAIEVLRQLTEFLDAKDSRRIATIAADHRGRAIAAAADIAGDQQRVKTRPKAWVDRNRGHRTAPCNVGSRNGLGAGTGGGCGGRPKAGHRRPAQVGDARIKLPCEWTGGPADRNAEIFALE